MLHRPESSLSPQKTLNEACLVIAEELQQVGKLIQCELSDSVPFVDEVIKYAFHLGGKRLRPTLLLLSGKTVGVLTPNHFFSAAALELVHTATLIHDDILDGALLRRHLETMNIRWGADVSVMAGDFLLAKSMDMITRLEDINAYRIIARACFDTCYGELWQLGTKSHFQLTADEYFQIIGAKTAALLECACQIGVFFSSQNPQICETFQIFGRNLGIAFQVIDDLLDLVGDEQRTGKTLGTDLARKKPTLPVILFLDTLSSNERKTFITQWENNAEDPIFLADLAKQVQTSGSAEKAMIQARKLAKTAISGLEQLPKQVISSPEAFQSLLSIAEFVVSREK